ncbi:MAG: hypothetical protein CBC38_01050 [Gammaproteobacteria bacterium TMED78]|nr:MAG: hypothetical protein CBC38_01050 [Gammaproteobacteria bacterium TMED78]
MKNISIHKFITKISKYGSVSAVTTIFDFSILYFIDTITTFPRTIISIFTYLLGSTLGYFINTKYVFSPGWLDNHKKSELSLYIASGILGSIITGSIFYLTASIGINNIFIQKLTASLISFTLIFIIRNNFIFRI